MTTDIRPLTTADVEGFVRLRREALTDSPLAFSASPEDDVGLSSEFMRSSLGSGPGSAVFGAFAPQLVGVVGLYRDSKQKSAHKVHIWGMYVSPEYRDQGIGRRLLDAALDYSRQLEGVTLAQIGVSETAPAARALYESCGFRSWGKEPAALLYARQSVSRYHMSLSFGDQG